VGEQAGERVALEVQEKHLHRLLLLPCFVPITCVLPKGNKIYRQPKAATEIPLHNQGGVNHETTRIKDLLPGLLPLHANILVLRFTIVTLDIAI